MKANETEQYFYMKTIELNAVRMGLLNIAAEGRLIKILGVRLNFNC
jgi:hypothetical protein